MGIHVLLIKQILCFVLINFIIFKIGTKNLGFRYVNLIGFKKHFSLLIMNGMNSNLVIHLFIVISFISLFKSKNGQRVIHN
jgi:hypothetical protein